MTTSETWSTEAVLSAIWFSQAANTSPIKIHRHLIEINGNEAMRVQYVRKRYIRRIRKGRKSHDLICLPHTSKKKNNAERLKILGKLWKTDYCEIYPQNWLFHSE